MRHRRFLRPRRWVLFVVVAACLAALGVGGALGAGSPAGAASFPSGVTGTDFPGPSAEMAAAARAGVDRERSRRESPAARAGRIRSRRLFARQSRDEAVAVARRQGGSVVDSPVWAPLRLGAGERLKGFVGSDQARIELAGGKDARVESMLPLRAKNQSGDLAPVDLTLEDRGSFFSPGNPLTALRVEKRLGDGLTLGDAGVRIVPAGSGDVQASLVSGKPFWANVETDTDMVVKPLPNGVESSTSFAPRIALSGSS